jgi:hypothetical protein
LEESYQGKSVTEGGQNRSGSVRRVVVHDNELNPQFGDVQALESS